MDPVLWMLLGAAVGAVLSVVATVLLLEPIQVAFSRLLGPIGPLQNRSLKGKWRSTYRYRSGDEDRQVTQIMELRQVGPFVVASCLETSGPHRHLVRARVRDRIVTGVWHNVARRANHRGALQLLILSNGECMRGKWVGFDRTHEVQHGVWEWEWLPDDVSTEEMKRLLDTPAQVPPPEEHDG